jgi:hypothetical protein
LPLIIYRRGLLERAQVVDRLVAGIVRGAGAASRLQADSSAATLPSDFLPGVG